MDGFQKFYKILGQDANRTLWTGCTPFVINFDNFVGQDTDIAIYEGYLRGASYKLSQIIQNFVNYCYNCLTAYKAIRDKGS